MALNCDWSYVQLEALCLSLGVRCVWVLGLKIWEQGLMNLWRNEKV